ncbi:MAG: hypothetical protein HKN36_10145 [Hellea sp.]|nr:hypothetical protein [Hellea sp.]
MSRARENDLIGLRAEQGAMDKNWFNQNVTRIRNNGTRLLWLGLTILIFNLFYWFVINPLIFSSPKGLNTIPVSNFSVAEISEPTFEAAQNTRSTPAELPFSACCAPQYHSLKFEFELADIPPNGLGFIKVMQVDNYLLFVNSTRLVSKGRMNSHHPTFHGQNTVLEHIPEGLLKAGRNDLQLVTVRSSTPYTDIRTPLLGEYESLRLGTSQRLWVMNEYKLLVMTICLLIGAVCLALSLKSRYKLFLFWFAILSLSWAANLLKYFIMDWPMNGQMRYLYYIFFTMLAPFALFNLVDSWTEKPIMRLQFTTIGIWTLLTGFLFYRYLYTPFPEGYQVSDTVVGWSTLIVSLAAIIRFIFHFWRHNDDRILEIASLSLIGVSIILDAYSEIIHDVPGGYASAVTPAFLIALILAFLNRNFHLFRSTQQINTFLGAELDAREAELHEAYENRKQLIRKQAHNEERQRLMRDMHDGLGSSLMSMLLSAKRGKAKPVDMADGLQFVIDEMRLIIDSMDSVGESVDVALKTYRERAETRVTDANMKYVWNDHTTTELPEYSARDVLQIFRILQEATTNAIRHSKGSVLKVDLMDHLNDPIGIQIKLTDNGQGKVGDSKRGRGLKNMAARAEQIGAKFSAENFDNGFRVSLVLPQKTTADTLEVRDIDDAR